MDTPFRFNFGGEEDEKAPNAAGPTERLAGTAEIDTVNTTPGTAGMETDLPSELQPDQVHRLLLIFIRADAGRTGLLELADAERLATLTRGTRVGDALATRSDRARADAWGFNAWSSAATDQGSNKGSSMTPDEWLETAANALRSSSAPDTEFAQFVSLAEAKLTPLPLISSSPPVSRQMRETSGKNYSHTLAVAAAVGNVGAMRYLMTNGFCDKEPKSASLDPSGQSVATFLSKLDVPVEHRGRETRSESESDSDSDSSEAEARFAATRERKARLSEAAEVLGMIEPRNKSTLSPKDPIWTRREWRPLPRSRKLAVDKATSRQMSGISAYERFNNGELTITNLCQALDALGPERRVKAIREISRVYNATLAPVTGRAYCRLTQRVLPIIRCQRCRVTAYCGLKQRDADAKQHARWCVAFSFFSFFFLLLCFSDSMQMRPATGVNRYASHRAELSTKRLAARPFQHIQNHSHRVGSTRAGRPGLTQTHLLTTNLSRRSPFPSHSQSHITSHTYSATQKAAPVTLTSQHQQIFAYILWVLAAKRLPRIGRFSHTLSQNGFAAFM